MTQRMVMSSSSSTRATGMPIWMVSITVLTALSRLGNGQTAALMEQLGFRDVADVDGGILAWTADGHPVVQ